jgi:RNA polymerase sigma-70 factor, ECF subfamily
VPDALFKALSRAGDIRTPGGLRIWLLRIARTTCLDHHRRARRLPVVPLDVVAESAASDPWTPAAISESADDLRRFKEAVLGLPRRLREVLVLREYGGLSYEDLSRTLKLRLGTVMLRLNRARKAIGAAMGERHD